MREYTLRMGAVQASSDLRDSGVLARKEFQFSLSCIDRNNHIDLATFLIKEKIQEQKCLLS